MNNPLHELGLPSDVLLWKALLLTAMSFGVGIIGGFVGLALGTVRLPILLLAGMPSTLAAGTNIIVSTASSFFGAIGHLRGRRVDFRVVVIMGIPSFAGAFLGGFYASRAPEGLLILTIGILVVWQGIELLNKARLLVNPGGVDSPMASTLALGNGKFKDNPMLAATTGLVIGVIGGAVGLILGSLRLPTLIRALGLGPRIAAGTNMFIGFSMGASGWSGHVLRGQVDYPMAILMAMSAIGGVSIGSMLTGRVGLRSLVGSMAIVLTIVGALMVWRGLGSVAN